MALVALRYVDEANLSNVMKWLARGSIPIAAILVPAAFFLSVLSPDARAPNGLIYLAYVGAVLLAVGVLALGVGLVRRPAQQRMCCDRSAGGTGDFALFVPIAAGTLAEPPGSTARSAMHVGRRRERSEACRS